MRYIWLWWKVTLKKCQIQNVNKHVNLKKIILQNPKLFVIFHNFHHFPEVTRPQNGPDRIPVRVCGFANFQASFLFHRIIALGTNPDHYLASSVVMIITTLAPDECFSMYYSFVRTVFIGRLILLPLVYGYRNMRRILRRKMDRIVCHSRIRLVKIVAPGV